ncbi:MAG: AEC family transporter [Burkholderiales bacterium]|nr:AEC family transporter [Burkholderiales bacterium]
MQSPVVSSLAPVVILIALGFLAGRMRWVSGTAVKELSNLVFLLLTPALLFRTMSKVQLAHLDFTPVAAYFIGVIALFAATLLVCGFNRRSAVLALAATFGNTVMIGIPFVSLAFGEAGLVTLFTLYTVHTVLLLTSATLVLELAVAREEGAAGGPRRSMARTVFMALRNSVIHPIPLPIIAGMLFAQTGLAIPPLLDTPLQLLASGLAPMALLLVGVTVAQTHIGGQLRGALALSAVKNLAHPALVATAGWALGLSGLPLAVMVVTAALPIGANVFLFSQRYKVAEELVPASVALSTVAALVTLSLVLALVQRL